MMLQKVVLFVLIFISGPIAAEVVDGHIERDVEYALNCNAKFGTVSDVVISGTKHYRPGAIIVYGHYKQAISLGYNASLLGGEFKLNKLSGVFKGIYKTSDNTLVRLKWKIGVKQGEVIEGCMNVTDW